MDEQSRPVEPQDGHGTEDTGENAAEAHGAGVPEQAGKQRAAYLDPRGSESTRELRDTARRRRDAEEKLQQHLMEAKHHVPNEFHEHEHQEHEHPGPEHGEHQHPDVGQTQHGTEAGAAAGEAGAGEAGGENS
jgi:hypothetical protein